MSVNLDNIVPKIEFQIISFEFEVKTILIEVTFAARWASIKTGSWWNIFPCSYCMCCFIWIRHILGNYAAQSDIPLSNSYEKDYRRIAQQMTMAWRIKYRKHAWEEKLPEESMLYMTQTLCHTQGKLRTMIKVRVISTEPTQDCHKQLCSFS